MGENKELEACLAYILKYADPKELDVIEAAVEKRKERLTSPFSIALNGEETAKRMADNINKSIMVGINGMTESIRNFSADLISREAPELSKEQAMALLDEWIPSDISFGGETKSISKNGLINGIPTDAMFNMVYQFVSYGIGEMSESEQQTLKNEIGDWTTKYWKSFPLKIQKLIKSFIDGEITSGEFKKTLTALLT